jgi:hypothetical protein
MVVIRGHFDGKVIVPDEPINLPDGQALIMHLDPVDSGIEPEPKPFFGHADQFLVDDPNLPEDLGKQLDHYLYGSPKIAFRLLSCRINR